VEQASVVDDVSAVPTTTIGAEKAPTIETGVRMARKRTRSTDDEIGSRLLDAGKTLIRTGTAIDDLTIADVLQLVAIEDGRVWTSGVVYPRFRSQESFRNAVLAELVAEGPHYRDRALSKMGSFLLGFPEDGTVDFDEPAGGAVRVSADEIASMMDAVATEQQHLMQADTGVASRQYARWRLAAAQDEPTQKLRERLIAEERRTSDDWVGLLEGFCRDLELRPAGDFGELTIRDFEIALSCLLDGMAVRATSEPIREGLYAKLVMALAIGFFEHESAPQLSMRERVVAHLRTGERKLVKTRQRFIEIMEGHAADAADDMADRTAQVQMSAPVARALAAKNQS
jgi:hypothetical protein